MKYKNIIITLSIIAVILLYCITTGTDRSKSQDEGGVLMNGKYNVLISVQGYGDIKVELDGSAAPITVTNFINLVNQGFYDNLTFHRIMKGFMIQGGDPEGTGFGGSPNKIKGEFAENGWNNPISHTRGVISMARATDPNSASSQFFIVHQDARSSLDGKYAAFGHVVSGMEVVDAIAENARPIDNNGTIPRENQPVITSIRVVQ